MSMGVRLWVPTRRSTKATAHSHVRQRDMLNTLLNVEAKLTFREIEREGEREGKRERERERERERARERERRGGGERENE